MGAITLPIGTELGGYVLAGVLGSGASGTVYRAKDAEGLPVALKLLHPAVAADAAARRRLEREVEAQRAIRSPFVAQVVDVELDGAEVFIVTELVEGISLAQDIARTGPWPPLDLVCLARDLDQALAAVHAAGVVHRDIKPSNVVLNQRGRPTLIDFGIAQGFSSDRLTGTGLVAGTPGFVSPELLRGGDPTPESDRWAAAALLLNAATGRQPYGSGAVEAVLTRVLDGTPDVEGLPVPMATAFGEALDPWPERRLSLTGLATALHPDAARTSLIPAAPEDLPPTRVAPALPGEASGEPTGHLWTEPPVVDYRRWVAKAAPPVYPPAPASAVAPGSASFPPHDAVRQALSPYPTPPSGAVGPLLGLWALFSAAALHLPWVVAGVGAGLFVAARAVWVAVQALTMRRFRRGQRASDPARLAFGVPWYLVRGLFGTLPALALAVGVGFGGYLAAVHLAGLAAGAGWLGAAAVAVGLVLVWWGPSGAETRYGGRTVLRFAAPTRARRAWLSLGLLACTGAILVAGGV
ncbi:MAG: serine/threonine protein kinase [Bifidobacteriaceae bacterium]|jgi:hypothetical protein|nr:serine/threonine protein kinase [Bifidobacteriaceae bacterium]